MELKEGQSVKVVVEGKTYIGVIAEIGRMAVGLKNNKSFRWVEVNLSSIDEKPVRYQKSFRDFQLEVIP